MTRYEYKVLPAPKRGEKVRGLRGTEARFAHALEVLMNEQGAEGWEYQRTDTLPCEERVGFTGRTTTFQHVLVFRKSVADETAEAPRLLERPSDEKAPAIELVGQKPKEQGKAPPVGGARKDDPGKTANAPDIAQN